MIDNVGQEAVGPDDVGLFCGLMRRGATAVPTQTPPMLEGMKGGYWRSYLLLLDRQLRDSNVTVKC